MTSGTEQVAFCDISLFILGVGSKRQLNTKPWNVLPSKVLILAFLFVLFYFKLFPSY
jgi:hypothetical protein